MRVIAARVAVAAVQTHQISFVDRLVRSRIGRRSHVVNGDHHCVRSEITVIVGHRVRQRVSPIVVRREAEVLCCAVRDHLAVIGRDFPKEGVRVQCARVAERTVQHYQVAFGHCLVRACIHHWSGVEDSYHGVDDRCIASVVSDFQRYAVGCRPIQPVERRGIAVVERSVAIKRPSSTLDSRCGVCRRRAVQLDATTLNHRKWSVVDRGWRCLVDVDLEGLRFFDIQGRVDRLEIDCVSPVVAERQRDGVSEMLDRVTAVNGINDLAHARAVRFVRIVRIVRGSKHQCHVRVVPAERVGVW